MWKLLWKILKTGNLTEAQKTDPGCATPSEYRHSAAIRHLDAGSCNGCELELSALENPVVSLGSRGLSFVASPRHADILLVTGPVTCHMREALEITSEAMPSPKRTVAVGDCAKDGGIFRGSYAVLDGLPQVMEVDVFVPGCPPKPEEIVEGLLRAFAEKKQTN